MVRLSQEGLTEVRAVRTLIFYGYLLDHPHFINYYNFFRIFDPPANGSQPRPDTEEPLYERKE